MTDRESGELVLMRIAVVVGNPKPSSRTLNVALAVADAVGAVVEETESRLIVDLADLGADLVDWRSEHINGLCAEDADCELIVVASPTYKATYTGLLKLFLDRYGNWTLEGRVAVTGAAGGTIAIELVNYCRSDVVPPWQDAARLERWPFALT
jgi:FMN reductase